MLFSVGSNSLRMFSKFLLPTSGDVLRRLMHLRFVSKLTMDASIEKLVREIMNIWEKLSVITRAKVRVKICVQKLFNEYRKVKQNRSRRSVLQIRKEKNFTDCSISHTKVFSIVIYLEIFLLQYSTQFSNFFS